MSRVCSSFYNKKLLNKKLIEMLWLYIIKAVHSLRLHMRKTSESTVIPLVKYTERNSSCKWSTYHLVVGHNSKTAGVVHFLLFSNESISTRSGVCNHNERVLPVQVSIIKIFYEHHMIACLKTRLNLISGLWRTSDHRAVLFYLTHQRW